MRSSPGLSFFRALGWLARLRWGAFARSEPALQIFGGADVHVALWEGEVDAGAPELAEDGLPHGARHRHPDLEARGPEAELELERAFAEAGEEHLWRGLAQYVVAALHRPEQDPLHHLGVA